ncbi:DUF4129 domain-containing protein [Rarobacter incanus]|uniref:Uncharacterized protein DUF4129 n=1 Tax=Rarobacter incanus TaxID=153494 RepID=A0A542SNP6_9MICO|nr:DUF4129 domain-containing protein [Rarobacter incanus]TQK76202.1 uncharacterized protein DUF4129 [Rarobacter incanus]
MKFAVPVTPDAATAQKWARDELSQPIYNEHEDPLTWLMRKLSEFFSELVSRAGGGTLGLWLVAGVIIAVVLAVIVIAGPLRTIRRKTQSAASLDDRTVSARDLRDGARAALREEDWNQAIILGYRAMVQDGVERTIIVAPTGMTAHEAAEQLCPAFPEFTAGITAFATLFDAVCYSDLQADAQQARSCVQLTLDAAAARPQWQDDSAHDTAVELVP